MGNFVSKPARSPGGRETIIACFSALADAIASCPRLAANAKFLLVPGKITINNKQYFRIYGDSRKAPILFIYLLLLPSLLFIFIFIFILIFLFVSTCVFLLIVITSIIYISFQFYVPSGPLDAGTNNALPRRAIPEEFIKDLRKKVTHVTFASNPCRVRFFTQEIVLFREDLLRKMQRHVVVPPSLDSEGHDICQQLVESILDQGHLCPLPLHVRPVYWDLDYTLRLSPLPHLVRQTHTQMHAHITCLPYSPLALLPSSNLLLFPTFLSCSILCPHSPVPSDNTL